MRYREKVHIINTKLAEQYGNHPAVVAWHVSNEYGGMCYCDLCEEEFQEFLRKRYDNDIEKLNHAYWSCFWSHKYTKFEEIEFPRTKGESSIHGLNLDFKRFVSHQTTDFMNAEIEAIRAVCPNIPITTNVLQIADITLTVVYTHEDLVDEDGVFPCGDYNATSTVIMAEAASGMRFLITGDINEMAEDKMCSHFTGKTLKCDILQQPHHNFNDNKLVYEYGDTQVMLMTQASGGLIKNELMTKHSSMAKKWCREWYCGGDETVGFTYKSGEVKLIYHEKVAW